jgi:hypothetical protein
MRGGGDVAYLSSFMVSKKHDDICGNLHIFEKRKQMGELLSMHGRGRSKIV